MQRFRTRHDIRGICFQGGSQFLGPGNTLTGGASASDLLGQAGSSDFNPFSLGASAGPGPLQANANIGLFQVPISASFLNPSATTTFDPTVYANPNVTQGPFSNSLILGPQFGGGQISSASLFGGGGGGKGGGGNITDNINYSPTTNVTSNLPNIGNGFPNMPNMLQGGAQQNVITRPNMLPMPPSQAGMMMPTIQPIAAGGISPTFAGMMAVPQQQQIAQPGQQVIPGTAAQSGGYDMPQPQGNGIPGMPPMPQQQGGMPQMQGSPASMFGALNPMAMAFPQGPDQTGAPMPGLRGPMGESASPALAMGGAPQAAPQRIQRPLQAGAGTNVRPDPTLSASQQEILQKQQSLSGAPSSIADKAKQDYDKAVEAAWQKYQKDTAEPEAARKKGEDATKTAMEDMQKLGTPDGLAKARNDAEQNVIDSLPPKVKAAYDRAAGVSKSSRMATAMSWAHRFARAGVAGFQPFTTDQISADDLHSYRQKQQDAAVYKAVQEETDKQMAHQIDLEKSAATQANRMATQGGADLTRMQTGYNQAENQAYKSTIEAGSAAGTAISHESSILGHISNILRGGEEQENALVNQGLAKQRLVYDAENAESNRIRAGTGQEAYQLQDLKYKDAQEKRDLENQNLKDKIQDMKTKAPLAARGQQLTNQQKIKTLYKDVLDEDVEAAMKARFGGK